MSTMMKAVMASKFGSPNEVLSIRDTPKPTLPTNKDALLIQVNACSLSPGDYRALLGDKTVVCNPTMPYIPGGDVCGVVVEQTTTGASSFLLGDTVVATWDTFGQGGMGEYMIVDPNRTVKLPETLTAVQGAALANSASHALSILDRASIQTGDRVLVLGGSGGVGTILLQLLKSKGASYVAATSTDTSLLKELGVDKAINYKESNWWEDEDLIKNPLDVIIDAAEGKQGWDKVINCNNKKSVLKGANQGGRWIAVVFNDWHIDGKHYYQIFELLFPPLARQLWNVVRQTTPYYRMYLGTADKKSLERALTMAGKQEFKVIVDPKSPHAFTEADIKEAWNLHIARKGHGKIVISIGENK